MDMIIKEEVSREDNKKSEERHRRKRRATTSQPDAEITKIVCICADCRLENQPKRQKLENDVIAASTASQSQRRSESIGTASSEQGEENAENVCVIVDVSEPPPWYSVLESDYQLYDMIGKGGFGMVYGGTRKSDGQVVAIKKIPKYQVDRFGTLNGKAVPIEFQLLKKVSGHPGIVEMLDYYEIENDYILIMKRPYPVMDLLKFRRHCGPQTEETVRTIMSQLIKAVIHSHLNGVIHRDIKDANVLINLQTMEATLIDFGCGDLLRAAPYYTFQGTPIYAPPEWFTEKRYRGKDFDVWGLGALFYVLLEDRPPFKTWRDAIEKDVIFNRPLLPSCKHIVRQMLKKDPRLRPRLSDVLRHEWFLNY